MRTYKLAVVGATALATVFAIVGPGLAATAGGIKGDPQPELKPFNIGAASSAASVAMEPDGKIATVFHEGTSGTHKIEFCVINRGGTGCSVKSLVTTDSGDSVFGEPQVIVGSDTNIDILMDACCDSNPSGGDLLFRSTDGGKMFTPGVRVGSEDISEGVAEAGEYVVAGGGGGDGVPVTAVSLTDPAPPAATATLSSGDSMDVFVSNYKGGVLVADTNFQAADKALAYFAPSGSDFTSAGSYTSVGDFHGEAVLGASGDALLTQQQSGKDKVLLRTFDGSKFSSPHAVPDYKNAGPADWFITQDPSGRIEIFSVLAANSYDLYERTTGNGGKSFSTPEKLYNAINSSSFGVALDSIGAGVAVGTDTKAVGYPILAAASVSIKLSTSNSKVNKSVKISGKVSPISDHGTVELQYEKDKKWYELDKTKQDSHGAYTFKLKKSSPETLTLRVQSNDRSGYVQYGYSAPRNLTFYKPSH